MRIGFAPWGESLAEMMAAGKLAEKHGIDSLWTSELHRTGVVTAAALSLATNRAAIGTAALLAPIRSPMVTALAALDLDELSRGRFILGLAPGVRRLIEEWHGASFDQPIVRLRETVAQRE